MIAAPGVKCDFGGRRRAFNMLPCYRHRCSPKLLVCSHRPLTMMTRLVWIRTFSPRGNCSRSSSIVTDTIIEYESYLCKTFNFTSSNTTCSISNFACIVVYATYLHIQEYYFHLPYSYLQRMMIRMNPKINRTSIIKSA